MDLLNYLHGGKNSKFEYYVSAYTALCTPRCILRALRRHALAKARGRKDWSEIESRLNWYNRLDSGKPFESQEFKESLGQLDKGLKSITAMLNRHGEATVYFGVDDDGNICGLDIGKDTLMNIRNSIANKIEPRIYAEIKDGIDELIRFSCECRLLEGNE